MTDTTCVGDFALGLDFAPGLGFAPGLSLFALDADNFVQATKGVPSSMDGRLALRLGSLMGGPFTGSEIWDELSAPLRVDSFWPDEANDDRFEDGGVLFDSCNERLFDSDGIEHAFAAAATASQRGAPAFDDDGLSPEAAARLDVDTSLVAGGLEAGGDAVGGDAFLDELELLTFNGDTASVEGSRRLGACAGSPFDLVNAFRGALALAGAAARSVGRPSSARWTLAAFGAECGEPDDFCAGGDDTNGVDGLVAGAVSWSPNQEANGLSQPHADAAVVKTDASPGPPSFICTCSAATNSSKSISPDWSGSDAVISVESCSAVNAMLSSLRMAAISDDETAPEPSESKRPKIGLSFVRNSLSFIVLWEIGTAGSSPRDAPVDEVGPAVGGISAAGQALSSRFEHAIGLELSDGLLLPGGGVARRDWAAEALASSLAARRAAALALAAVFACLAASACATASASAAALASSASTRLASALAASAALATSAATRADSTAARRSALISCSAALTSKRPIAENTVVERGLS
jgi:hypothetical protein